MSLINDKNPVNQIDIKCLSENGAVVPSYETLGSAGADIRAFLEIFQRVSPATTFAVLAKLEVSNSVSFLISNIFLAIY